MTPKPPRTVPPPSRMMIPKVSWFFLTTLLKYFHSKFHIILSFVPFDIFTKNLKIMLKPISKHIFVPKRAVIM